MNRRITACVALAGLLALIFASASFAASGRPQPISKPATAHASAGAFHARTFAAPTVGETFNSTTGSWTESPTKFTYQWEDCNTSGLSCVAIAGATCVQIGPNTACPYTLQASDTGDTIVVLVTAYNSIGSASNSSLASGVVTAPVPVISSVPTVSGAVTQGSTLTATNGTWTNSPTGYATQWYECPASCTGSNFTAISGAVGSTYITESTDVGDVLYATVTASNASGSGTPSSSVDTAVVTAAGEAPVSILAPVLSGTATQGDVLTATGTGATYWDNTPVSYAYQWKNCVSPCTGVGTPISGATSSTYTLQSTDVGLVVYVEVTATNATGSGVAFTDASAIVTASGSGGFTGTCTSTISASSTSGAVASAESGLAADSVLCLNTGTYGTASTINVFSHGGTAGHPVVVTSGPGQTALLLGDEQMETSNLTLEHMNIDITNSGYTSNGGADPAPCTYPVTSPLFMDGANLTFQSNNIYGSTQSLRQIALLIGSQATTSDAIVRWNKISDEGHCGQTQHLLYVDSGTGNQIYQNWFWDDAYGYCVQIYPTPTNNLIYSNVFDGCIDGTVDAAAGGNETYNNVAMNMTTDPTTWANFTGGTGYAFYCYSGGGTGVDTVDNNASWNNSKSTSVASILTPGCGSFVTASGNQLLTSDPFVDSAAHNYNPTAGGPVAAYGLPDLDSGVNSPPQPDPAPADSVTATSNNNALTFVNP